MAGERDRQHGHQAAERSPVRRPSEELKKEGYVRAENPVVLDAQLDGDLEGGPEKRNPEGSVDISNEVYREADREE